MAKTKAKKDEMDLESPERISETPETDSRPDELQKNPEDAPAVIPKETKLEPETPGSTRQQGNRKVPHNLRPDGQAKQDWADNLQPGDTQELMQGRQGPRDYSFPGTEAEQIARETERREAQIK